MSELTEIRWHARAGQGAKTASQMLALGLLRSGRSVQAFPEYGPERRGAPLRAYTRISDRPIRRHDAVEHPDLVVVLEPSLVREAGVTEGLEDKSFVLLNADDAPAELDGTRVVCIPASRIAAEQGRSCCIVVVVVGVGDAVGEPALEELRVAAVELLGKKLPPDSVRSAVEEGYRCLS